MFISSGYITTTLDKTLAISFFGIGLKQHPTITDLSKNKANTKRFVQFNITRTLVGKTVGRF